MTEYKSERPHIGIFGKRNSGKSSLLNYISGSNVAIVSNNLGTTTDPIYKTMEIHDFGPVVFIDTAGLDDNGDLGEIRVQKSLDVIEKCDLFIYVLSLDDDMENLEILKKKNKEILYLATKQDTKEGKEILEKYKNLNPLAINIKSSDDKNLIFNWIRNSKKTEERSITGNLVKNGDFVVLVMPQDKEAPKGRLIKPQVMTVRELLDKSCTVISTDLENLSNTLNGLKNKPDLVIVDSKVFKEVYELIDKDIRLTSFSVLFSALKGDISYFIESVKVLDKKVSKVLIAEACNHPPIDEDIGTVKIPKMLRKKYPDIQIDFTRSDDFKNIKDYDLIIHCGACMFNRSHVMNRVKRAREEKVPMTNYGITIAYLKGILDKISY